MLGSSVEGVGIFLQPQNASRGHLLAAIQNQSPTGPRMVFPYDVAPASGSHDERWAICNLVEPGGPGRCSACGTNFSKSPLARLEPPGQQAGALMLQHMRGVGRLLKQADCVLAVVGLGAGLARGAIA